MNKFSLVNVAERKNGRVSGVWLQDVTGTKNEAFKCARDTEKANGNRIEVAVVKRIEGSTPNYDYLTSIKEVVSN
ncbi:hypothetical protein L8C07_05370 [Paenibacillus sp. CMAA1739]|uniref:hypothetical protein n=1 Tax=Paenibacillus ottowii TaxID=2315729 RepID=UPI002DBC5C36|nr:hypothetical protein [Paenibacillus sp. CMAA1739]MEC4565367.1 hypothetical protein [Paenibacillus sp. CMAA1739]